MSTHERQIVPGITLLDDWNVAVDDELNDVLHQIANDLQSDSELPVDAEVVLAAIVTAVERGEISPDTSISTSGTHLRTVLSGHVRALLEEFYRRDEDG